VAAQETRDFLDALYGCEVSQDSQIVVWAKQSGSRWCPSIDDAVAAVSRLTPHEDAYFGVQLQSPELVRERVEETQGSVPTDLRSYRGYASTVAAMPGLWVDLDVAGAGHRKNGLPESIEDALAFLGDFGFAPSVTVQSGGGVHLYWLFEEPWIMEDDEERGLAAALIRRWQERIRKVCGYTVDATHDLSRVLRPPGTVNTKYGSEVSAEILSGLRYAKEDLIAYVEDGGSLGMVSDPVIVDPPARVRVEESVQPPLEKLLDLLNLHPQFAATWRRERTDLPSQSEYDMSLATMTAKFGWTPDEIASLIIAHRKQGGEPLKLDRPRYYQMTIAKAMAANATVIAHDRLSERVDAIESGEASVDDERTGLYTDLSAMIGVHIIRIIRYVADPPQFRLVMEEGSIDLGGAETILTSSKFRVKVAGLSKRLIGRFTGQQWDPIAQAILRAAEDEDLGADSSPEGLVGEWMGEYLAQHRPETDRDQAVALKLPYWPGDEPGPLIFLGALQQWLAFFRAEKLSRKQLGVFLRSAGCHPRALGYNTEEGGKSTVHAWVVPGKLAGARACGRRAVEPTP
jgi:hypothetical protein